MLLYWKRIGNWPLMYDNTVLVCKLGIPRYEWSVIYRILVVYIFVGVNRAVVEGRRQCRSAGWSLYMLSVTRITPGDVWWYCRSSSSQRPAESGSATVRLFRRNAAIDMRESDRSVERPARIYVKCNLDARMCPTWLASMPRRTSWPYDIAALYDSSAVAVNGSRALISVRARSEKYTCRL